MLFVEVIVTVVILWYVYSKHNNINTATCNHHNIIVIISLINTC